MSSNATDHQLVSLTVNGTAREVVLDSRRTLADTLRHDLGLTGTHLACEHGICGACTVLVDGRPARSCLMFAVQAEGRRSGPSSHCPTTAGSAISSRRSPTTTDSSAASAPPAS